MKKNQLPAGEKRPEETLSLMKSRTPFSNRQKITERKFCLYSHLRGNCPAYNQICNTCKKRNHFVKMCPSNKHVKEIMQNDSDAPAFEEKQTYVGSIMAKTVNNTQMKNIQGKLNVRRLICHIRSKWHKDKIQN